MAVPISPAPQPTHRHDNPNELPARDQAILDHTLGHLRRIALAKGHQPGPWRFAPIPEEGPYTLQAECAQCGALLTIRLQVGENLYAVSGRHNTATRYDCPQRPFIAPHPAPLPGVMALDEFQTLLRIPAAESFPSEQALLDHLQALPGFTIVGSPGRSCPWAPGLYWVQLRRDSDGERGMVGFKVEESGAYRYAMTQGEISSSRLEDLLRPPAGEPFPSEEALIDHMRSLPGFTLVETPGPYQYYVVDLQREADGALGRAFFQPEAGGGYRYFEKAVLRNPRNA
jgi:hypothetical protein